MWKKILFREKKKKKKYYEENKLKIEQKNAENENKNAWKKIFSKSNRIDWEKDRNSINFKTISVDRF